jgi:endonuclease/exonuclease/phosphatase (EEP) superfamily protein YafD
VLPHSVLSPASGAAGTGLWTRLPTTELTPVSTTGFAMPRVRVDLPDETSVTVTAAHPFPPHHDAGIARWRTDMRGLHRAVEQTRGLQVVAGDFNATRDHAPFRRLLDAGVVDAADAEGLTAWPGMTWPADRPFPPVLRLDHVLASREFAVPDVTVVRLPGSDHRAVVANLVLTRGGQTG